MSLVTTSISSRSRSRLQSTSSNAVLPEPTGPPTPTRKGGFDSFISNSWHSHKNNNLTLAETRRRKGKNDNPFFSLRLCALCERSAFIDSIPDLRTEQA